MNHILLAGMPRLMVDIILPILASEADMAVVGHVGRDDMLDAARRAQADVVIVGRAEADREERDQYRHLLLELPHLKVVIITDDARSATLYEMQPRSVPLGEVSADTLLTAIRGQSSGGRTSGCPSN